MKHIVTYYGYDVHMPPSQDKKWLSRYRELFGKADLFLCEGPHMAKELVELGCPREKIVIQHLGVEMKKSVRASTPSTRRNFPNIAATFTEKKGIPYALEALAKLMRDVPLQITIIGDADSTKFRRN